MMPNRRIEVDDETVARWRVMYDEYANLADGEDLPVTPDLARTIARKHNLRWREVIQVLSQPHRYSPYPDGVAIERALDFDWPVVAHLSLLERHLVEHALSVHPDPYGEREASDAGVPTPRWMRYQEGGAKTRLWLRARVDEMIETQQEAVHV